MEPFPNINNLNSVSSDKAVYSAVLTSSLMVFLLKGSSLGWGGEEGGPGQRIVCATQPLHRVCPNRFSLAIKLNCANTALVAGLEGNLGTGGQCRRCATNTLISSPPRFLEWCRFSPQNWCKDCYGQFFIRVMEKIKVKVFCLDCDQNLSDVVWIVEMRGVAGDCWRAFIK